MKSPRPLFWRLYPSYLLITLLALLAVAVYNSYTLERFFLEQTAEDLKARARLLEGQITDLLAPLDSGAIDAVCKASGKRSGTRITVILPDGRVVGDSDENPADMANHSDRPEILQALANRHGRAVRYSQTLNTRMMYVAAAIQEKGRSRAVIRASLPVDIIDQRQGALQFRNLLMGLLIALIAAGVSLFISRRISRPIEEMRKGAEAFAAGNLNYRLPTPKSLEMVRLAQAMNQMASELDDRIQTVIRQRNESEAVLSSMMEGVIAVDLEERVMNINQAASRMFQRDPWHLEGRSIQEVVRNPALHRFVRRALSEKGPTEGEVTLYNEEECILSAHSSPLCDAHDLRLGTLIVFHDITRLRRLETMRRDFAANVSHEIKTPLTAIKGFVETLRDGAKDNPEEADRFLEIIDTHVNRLTAIIDDLMKLSEIEQGGRRGIALKTEFIRPVIEGAAEVCRTAAEEKRIAVEVDCDADLAAAVNPHFLEQAVVNLVENAVKYGREGSAIQITAEKTAEVVVIRVRDEGMGVPAEHLPRLFERFYRVDKSRNRKQGGTGLGLAIVKHIVQAHGGTVDVESAVGKGSVFSIRLPNGDKAGETVGSSAG